jgi:RimJ/RimL family protein N-acetyltransferase
MELSATAEDDFGIADFRLREIRDSDREPIVAAVADPRLARMLTWPTHPLSQEDADAILPQIRRDIAAGCTIRAIECGGRFAGLVSLVPHAPTGGLELGYWLVPDFWGRGLATAAAGALISKGIAPGIWARAAADNPASHRVLQKLGFEPVGQLERHFPSRGAVVPCRIFWFDRRQLEESWVAWETPRLLLAPPCRADLDRITQLAGDREISMQAARIPHPYTRRDAEFFLDRIATSEPTFAVRLKAEHGALIGCVGYRQQEDGRVELGYWLGRPYWGQGFATEALRTTIDRAFDATDAAEVFASARVTNSGSRRVLEKCGFQHSGTGLARSVSQRGTVAVDFFRLDRRAWASLTAWRPAVRRESFGGGK